MSDRWCDDCSWPYDCMAANACRRAEMGERRIAAPPETVDAIAAELAEAEVVSQGGPASMGRRRGVIKVTVRNSFAAPNISEVEPLGTMGMSELARWQAALMFRLAGWGRK